MGKIFKIIFTSFIAIFLIFLGVGYATVSLDFEIEHKGKFNVPECFEPCERIISNSVRYWQLPYRIYGKIMTILTNMFQ